MAKRTDGNSETGKRGNAKSRTTRGRRRAGSRFRASALPRFRELTHLDASGRARMVDVSAKPPTARQAVARGEVRMRPATLAQIRANALAKGDVLGVARIAGVQAAKRTGELIPLAHPLPLTGVDVAFRLNDEAGAVEIQATVSTVAPTGVEMEALVAVAVAALAIYDMCKAVDRDMTVGRVRLVRKTGGQSGEYSREGEP